MIFGILRHSTPIHDHVLGILVAHRLSIKSMGCLRPSTSPLPRFLQTAYTDEATVCFKLHCELRRHMMEGSSSDSRSYPGRLFLALFSLYTPGS